MRALAYIILIFALSACGSCERDEPATSGGYTSSRVSGGVGGGTIGGGLSVPFRPSCDMRGAAVGGRLLLAGGSSTAEVEFQSGNGSGDDTEEEVRDAGQIAVLDVTEDLSGEGLYTPRWSTLELPEPRRGFAMVTHGNRIFIAGGQRPLRNFYGGENFNYAEAKSNRVDVYDHAAMAFVEPMFLSEARSGIAGAAAGKYVVFLGGDNGGKGPSGELCSGSTCYYVSSRFDIYDTESNNWSAIDAPFKPAQSRAVSTGDKAVFLGDMQLAFWDAATREFSFVDLPPRSDRRMSASLTYYQGRIYLAGGHAHQFETYDLLQSYDVASGKWEEHRLAFPRAELSATGARGKLILMGGVNELFTFSGVGRFPEEGEIFDPITGTSRLTTLAAGRHRMFGVTVADRFAVFAGGLGGATGVDSKQNPTAAFEVYDAKDDVWFLGAGPTPRSVTPPPPMPEVPKDGSAVLVVAVPAHNEVRAYRVDAATGALSFASSAPTGTSPRNVAWDHASRRYVYASNEDSDSISGFSLSASGDLAEVSGSPFPTDGRPRGLAVSSYVVRLYATRRSSTLYVASTAKDSIAGYTVDFDTGSLTALTSPINPTGVTPHIDQIAVSSDQRYLYVPSSDGWIFKLNITKSEGYLVGTPGKAGLLTRPLKFFEHPKLPFGYSSFMGEDAGVGVFSLDLYNGRTAEAQPPKVATPDISVPIGGGFGAGGKFFYVNMLGSELIAGFAVDPVVGTLTEIAGFPFSARAIVHDIVAASNGRTLYLFHDDGIATYSVDQDNGHLSLVQMFEVEGATTGVLTFPGDP